MKKITDFIYKWIPEIAGPCFAIAVLLVAIACLLASAKWVLSLLGVM